MDKGGGSVEGGDGQWKERPSALRDDTRRTGAVVSKFESAFNIVFRASSHAVAYQHVTVPPTHGSAWRSLGAYSHQRRR